MYKRHIIIIMIVCAIVGGLSYYLKLDYNKIADAEIDIMSIASALYLAIYPLLQGSETLIKRLQVPDKLLPLNTQMGVLNAYIKIGLIMGIISIILGCIDLLIVGSIFENIEEQPLWYSLFSALAIAQFSGNFPLLWFVGKFMVNRVAFNR